jgi:hypothetical protein
VSISISSRVACSYFSGIARIRAKIP